MNRPRRTAIALVPILLATIAGAGVGGVLATPSRSDVAPARDLVAADFFTVPPATFQVLFVCVILAHHRRRILHLNVTANPTAAWTAQQVVEAFPDGE